MTTQVTPTAKPLRWRTVDIVVAAVLAVVGGVIFAVVSLTYHVFDPLWLAFPPSSGSITGLWLFPGVLAGLVVRRPGAALFVELVAAIMEAILGSSFGVGAVISGLLQGFGAELGIALLGRYRRFGADTAVLSGALAGVACGLNDAFLMRWYPEYSASWLWSYVGFVTLSGAVIGAVMFFLTRGLAATGVLASLRSRGAARESLLGR